MAVQAQYPSISFYPDFRTNLVSSTTRSIVLEEMQTKQDYRNLLQVYSRKLQQGFNNNNNSGLLTVFSDPRSELTCNNNISNDASGSRKRCREEPILPLLPQTNNTTTTSNQYFLPVSPSFRLPVSGMTKTAASAAVGAETSMSAGKYNLGRLLDSGATSTSGRPPQLVSPLAQGLVSHLYHHSLEIDALVRFQTERIRSGLVEAGKRNCRALLSILEQQLVKQLKEKETELENASRRNAELEEMVRQLTAENEIWFSVAKNSEAIASSLEQVLLQSVGTASPSANEGFGDTDGATTFPADDAQSCCFEEDDAGGEPAKGVRCRKSCKVCGEREVSVLMLPCRHLCLCKGCESKVDACPICRSAKNACVLIRSPLSSSPPSFLRYLRLPSDDIIHLQRRRDLSLLRLPRRRRCPRLFLY